MLETEWPALVERWRRSLHFYARAVRLNDPCAAWHLRALADTRRAAVAAGHGALAERHFEDPLWADDGREAWVAEAAHVLERGGPSGRYRRPPPRPLFPLRSDAERAADEERGRPSTVILRQPWAGYCRGAELSPPADVAWGLVENGIAHWSDWTRAPYDPRPPAEATPAADWVSLRFLIPSRLASRHTVAAGEVRLVPQDEAASLVERGLAEPVGQRSELPREDDGSVVPARARGSGVAISTSHR